MADALEPQALDPSLVEAVDALVTDAGITVNRAMVTRILTTGLLLGIEQTSRLDLKLTSAALAEMREAFRLFAPFRDVPKVSVFGSARTRMDDPSYLQARDLSHDLAAAGWMSVTGAGPGIMQAAAEGAGPAMSLGVSIRLPFEERANPVVAEHNQIVAMKYFFTRKLMLVKESRGFVCLPGGFGTLDEMFELLTLQQTGKATPVPIVLLNAPGSDFWQGLKRFIDEQMVPIGVIAADDFDRVLITDSADAAVDEVLRFWHNYESLRWVGDQLVLRLRNEPTDAEIAALNDQFGDMCERGGIAKTPPLAPERSDRDQLDLPRIVLVPRERQIGTLYRLIHALNALESAR